MLKSLGHWFESGRADCFYLAARPPGHPLDTKMQYLHKASRASPSIQTCSTYMWSVAFVVPAILSSSGDMVLTNPIDPFLRSACRYCMFVYHFGVIEKSSCGLRLVAAHISILRLADSLELGGVGLADPVRARRCGLQERGLPETASSSQHTSSQFSGWKWLEVAGSGWEWLGVADSGW
jgi:hypothetical protein